MVKSFSAFRFFGSSSTRKGMRMGTTSSQRRRPHDLQVPFDGSMPHAILPGVHQPSEEAKGSQSPDELRSGPLFAARFD